MVADATASLRARKKKRGNTHRRRTSGSANDDDGDKDGDGDGDEFEGVMAMLAGTARASASSVTSVDGVSKRECRQLCSSPLLTKALTAAAQTPQHASVYETIDSAQHVQPCCFDSAFVHSSSFLHRPITAADDR
jgi:hypothetical protein